MNINHVGLWVSLMYQGEKDITPQRIEGVVVSQKKIEGETLLTMKVADGVYRSVYLERRIINVPLSNGASFLNQ